MTLVLGIDAGATKTMALVSDEETGSGLGLDYLMQHHGGLFSPRDLIIVPDAGSGVDIRYPSLVVR